VSFGETNVRLLETSERCLGNFGIESLPPSNSADQGDDPNCGKCATHLSPGSSEKLEDAKSGATMAHGVIGASIVRLRELRKTQLASLEITFDFVSEPGRPIDRLVGQRSRARRVLPPSGTANSDADGRRGVRARIDVFYDELGRYTVEDAPGEGGQSPP
jgi:hypothetical protein